MTYLFCIYKSVETKYRTIKPIYDLAIAFSKFDLFKVFLFSLFFR